MIKGWVHRLRKQKKNIFMVVRDGSGFCQVLISGELGMCEDAAKVTLESTVEIYGVVIEDERAPDGYEIHANYWVLLGLAPEDFNQKVNKEAGVEVLMEQRHMTLRGKRLTTINKVRAKLIQCFRDHYNSECYFEITPPTIVNFHTEGGSDLFELNYFGKPAFMTQSSQLYLESVLPSLGDVYCICQSYRAEKSKTRRHLAEFMHVEAECPFITFDEFLNRIELLITDVFQRLLDSEYHDEIMKANPKFLVPKRPFRRMKYTEAIEYCIQNQIPKNEQGDQFQPGDEITEKPERQLTDQIGEPIFLTNFPSKLKQCFYMKKNSTDPELTDSVDLLIPGVGEVIGGSMRVSDYDELYRNLRHFGIDPAPYYWYLDQRKYGTCPHGGYGLGLERVLCYIMNIEHIRDAVLYPRMFGRIEP